jgi:hypothetical protein
VTVEIGEFTVVILKMVTGELNVLSVTVVIGGAYCIYCDSGDSWSLLYLVREVIGKDYCGYCDNSDGRRLL